MGSICTFDDTGVAANSLQCWLGVGTAAGESEAQPGSYVESGLVAGLKEGGEILLRGGGHEDDQNRQRHATRPGDGGDVVSQSGALEAPLAFRLVRRVDIKDRGVIRLGLQLSEMV